MIYFLVLLILLLIIYDTFLSQKSNLEIIEMKTNIPQEKEEEKNETEKNCINDNDKCKMHFGSIESKHPSFFDWSSLNVKY